MNNETKPEWSIVICCHNAAPRIEGTLRALDRQTWAARAPVEIVVVDNNCSDETASLAERFRFTTGCRLRVVRESTPGVAYARVTGVKAATGTYVCYVDDDNHLSPDYLEQAAAIFERYPDVAFCGGRSAFPEGYRVPLLARFFSKSLAVGCQREFGEGYLAWGSHLWGAGLCVRRGALMSLYDKGFAPVLQSRTGGRLLSGEDAEVTVVLQLVGGRGYYSDALCLVHWVNLERLSIRYFLRLMYGFGLSAPVVHEYSLVARRVGSELGTLDDGIARNPASERIRRLRGYRPAEVLRVIGYLAAFGTVHAWGVWRGRRSELVARARAQAARIVAPAWSREAPRARATS